MFQVFDFYNGLIIKDFIVNFQLLLFIIFDTLKIIYLNE